MDERDREDGYLLGVLARLQFDGAKCPLGLVPTDLLQQEARLQPHTFGVSLDSLVQRGLIEGTADRLNWRLTPAARELIRQFKERGQTKATQADLDAPPRPTNGNGEGR